MILSRDAGGFGLIRVDHRRAGLFSEHVIHASLEESLRLQKLWEARKPRTTRNSNCPFDTFLFDHLLYFLAFTDRLLFKSSLPHPEQWMNATSDAVREWYLSYTLARLEQICGFRLTGSTTGRLLNTAITDAIQRWGHEGKRRDGLPEIHRDLVEAFAPPITLTLCGDDRIENFPNELTAERHELRSASDKLLTIKPYSILCEGQ